MFHLYGCSFVQCLCFVEFWLCACLLPDTNRYVSTATNIIGLDFVLMDCSAQLCDVCGEDDSHPLNLFVYCDGVCHILNQTPLAAAVPVVCYIVICVVHVTNRPRPAQT